MMISVIVPIYNIEKYLVRCLDSLSGQTFQDAEFLLVDDGSTDSSGEIADRYPEKDSRFRVFHTENQGLSAARNFGISRSKGEWLMFVDSDDWVAPGFCEIPYQAADRENAELVIFRSAMVKNGRKHEKRTKGRPCGLIDSETATFYGGVVVWNKLYKRYLFDTIHFPEGRVFEDKAITHKILHSAKRIIMISDILYYHVYRRNSISHARSESYKRDSFLFALQRYEDLKSYGYDLQEPEEMLWFSALAFMARTESIDNHEYIKAANIVDSIIGIPAKLRWQGKILLIIWKINKNWFHYICKNFE